MNDKGLMEMINSAVLIQPRRLPLSAWHGHIPFASWITTILEPATIVELGTHSGCSYLCFCQTVLEQALNTKCYAVDTWDGDEHSGFYGEEVYRDLASYHDPLYGAFSRLVRSTFDDAADHFESETIDLLHIDGLHTFEAVEDDFRTWLPKMSSSGVVLFHDINVRERGFGVWRLWADLRERFPSIEFDHFHGLGVLFVGDQPSRPALSLVEAWRNAPDVIRIKRLFALLGERISQQFVLGEIEGRMRGLQVELDELRHAINERDDRIVSLDASRAESEKLDAELEELRDQLKNRDGTIASLGLALAGAEGRLSDHMKALATRDVELSSLMAEVAARNARIEAFLQSTSWRLTRPVRWFGDLAKRVRHERQNALPDALAASTRQGGRSLLADSSNGRAIVDRRFQLSSPLPVIMFPGIGQPRINLVTDSINGGSLFGGVATAIILASQLAEACDARLRVITRLDSPQVTNVAHILEQSDTRLTTDTEFLFAQAGEDSAQVDVNDSDFFLTTSWWTTRSTMESVQKNRVLYLLQEDERLFYPHGDDRLRCEQTLLDESIMFAVNTRLLYDHLVGDGFVNLTERGRWFEPAFPDGTFYSEPKPEHHKHKLLFYARPNNPRNLFYLGLEVLEEAILRGTIDLNEWDVVLVGKDVPALTLGNGYKPECYENLSWASYAGLTRTTDLGLCLMYSPHPSYPPLDLVASGAVVVTNRYGLKNDLSSYSSNLIATELDREALIRGLEEGVSLARNAEVRRANALGSNYQRSWADAFREIVDEYSRYIAKVC